MENDEIGKYDQPINVLITFTNPNSFLEIFISCHRMYFVFSVLRPPLVSQSIQEEEEKKEDKTSKKYEISKVSSTTLSRIFDSYLFLRLWRSSPHRKPWNNGGEISMRRRKGGWMRKKHERKNLKLLNIIRFIFILAIFMLLPQGKVNSFHSFRTSFRK